jgi:hypothetical protein
MCIRVVTVSLAFTIGVQTFGADALQKVVVEAIQAQSDNGTFGFGEGRFEVDGKVPKGFTEFQYLYLEGGSFKLAPDGKRMIADSPANLKGELYGRLRFKMKKATLEGDTLTFETQVVRGISFQFSGTIFNATTEKDQPATIGIKGRLSKLISGKKVTEAQVTFDYLEPED